MAKLRPSFFLYGIGVLGILFALGRTYYLMWKSRKNGEVDGFRTRDK